MTSLPDHTHPELERDNAKRYRLLHDTLTAGFANLEQHIRDGFTEVSLRFDELDARVHRIEERLGAIEERLRRISPNGNQP